MAYATINDIETRYRDLTASEETIATAPKIAPILVPFMIFFNSSAGISSKISEYTDERAF